MIRLFDILFSGVALIILIPFLIPIILILSVTGESEVFFLQERIGKDGNIFKLFKFATMLKNSPNIGMGTITVKNDSRILPIGKLLRKTKINELPQLLNILSGDMSVIGPRPLTKETFNSYSHDIQSAIKLVRPGLSGIGSIIFRAEEDLMQGELASVEFYETIIAPYKGLLEKWFVKNNGLYVYFASIITTVIVVLNPSSSIAWVVFKDLPAPPKILSSSLGYRA